VFDALYVGATGMHAHQVQIDTIAHNVANLNTIGFRRGVVTFSEVSAALRASGVEPGSLQLTGPISKGAGVTNLVTLSSLGGELKETNEPLDVAVDGLGFLEVLRADGTPAYTRSTRLKVNADGMLSTADGAVLAGQIHVPQDAREILIGSDGRVAARVADAEEPVDLGQIDLVAFANPSALQAAGQNLYVASSASGEARTTSPGEEGMGVVRQGFVESSNVQLADEMVTLMLAQRAFELNARVVQAADQMLSITNSLYR
jgi:flagellar basal-body rod protein FlgG